MIDECKSCYCILTGMAWKAKAACYTGRETEAPSPEG